MTPNEDESTAAGASEKTSEQAVEEGVERTISLDEFNPTGTLVLLGIYFVILAVMWLFMYFVEFAGRDISITG